MALKYRKGRPSPGWIQAVVFNTLLLCTPLLAANAVSGLFSTQSFTAEPNIESILATRARIDSKFGEIVPRGANRRAYWARLIDQALREDNLPAARGFLVAAPHMLDHYDGKALFAAANDDPFGTEDQKLLRAALLFLPNDVRARYERKLQPATIVSDPAPRPSSPADLLGEAGGDRPAVQTAALGTPPLAPARPDNHSPQFSLLGTFADLSRHSRRWVRDLDDPGIELRLTGFGLMAPDLPQAALGDLTIEDTAQATSVLRSALRADRLQPDFVARLERALDATLPAPQLRLNLSEAFSGSAMPTTLPGDVETAFRDTLAPAELELLVRDLRQVSAIASVSSSVSTVALIEHVKSGDDLRRLRAVVQAGDDRATALETRIGEDVIDLARTGVAVSRYTVIQAVALAGALIVLFWLAAVAAQKEWRGRFASSSYG